MNDAETQCKRIVEYIREKGCITSLEAYQKLKVGGCRQPVTHYSIVENGVEVWAQD
jgi:hypothetical protein